MIRPFLSIIEPCFWRNKDKHSKRNAIRFFPERCDGAFVEYMSFTHADQEHYKPCKCLDNSKGISTCKDILPVLQLILITIFKIVNTRVVKAKVYTIILFLSSISTVAICIISSTISFSSTVSSTDRSDFMISPIETSRASAKGSIVFISGKPNPLSHLLTALSVTRILEAKSFCEN